MNKLLLRWLQFQRENFVLFLALLLGVVSYGAYIAFDSEIMAFPEFTNVQLNIQTNLERVVIGRVPGVECSILF